MEKVYFESGVEDSSTPDSKNTYIVMDGECGDDGAGDPLGKWNDILDRPLRSRPHADHRDVELLSNHGVFTQRKLYNKGLLRSTDEKIPFLGAFIFSG